MSFTALSRDELIERLVRTESHARGLSDRTFFLESVVAQALHEHSRQDKVCVCKRCAILRRGMRYRVNPEKESKERERAGDIELPDDDA
jgi:hypothetical protein